MINSPFSVRKQKVERIKEGKETEGREVSTRTTKSEFEEDVEE